MALELRALDEAGVKQDRREKWRASLTLSCTGRHEILQRNITNHVRLQSHCFQAGEDVGAQHEPTKSQATSIYLGETNMNTLDSMLQRNKDFAAQQSAAGTLMPSLPQALPNVKAIIIGCADMRVDPSDVLGIKLGEAVVMRNIGGRITPGLLEQLGLLGRIGEVAGQIPGGGGEFHIIVLQHTDCGITRLVGNPASLAHYFQIQEAELKTKAVTDPRAAVAADVAALRAIPALPSQWLISGLVYDVGTGLVEVVVPAARIRAAAA
jgi:carbonic anhydrase